MNHVLEEIAEIAADQAVKAYGQHLDPLSRMKLWSQYHDAVLASLIAYEGVMQARRLRTQTLASEN